MPLKEQCLCYLLKKKMTQLSFIMVFRGKTMEEQQINKYNAVEDFYDTILLDFGM